MAALTITAANIIPDLTTETPQTTNGKAGATITAGQTVYLDPADGLYKLCDVDSATAVARSCAGIALNGAASGQPLSVMYGGDLAFGAILTKGTTYIASATAGSINPVADGVTTWQVNILGVALSTSVMRLGPVKDYGVQI